MPPAHLVALVAYAGVLVAELSRLSEQLRANSDVASVLLVGNGVASGTAGRPIEAGQPAYAWLVAALDWVGHETVVWTVLPLVVTWLGLAGIVLAVARVSGGWPAGLALALGVGAAPAVLLTEVAPAFHGMAWGAVGLLGWYTVAIAIHVACTLYFCVMIARDMLHPERDPVPPDLAPPAPAPWPALDPAP